MGRAEEQTGRVRPAGSSSPPSGSAVTPSLLHTAQAAIVVNLALVFAALLCSLVLPSSLGSDRAEENA